MRIGLIGAGSTADRIVEQAKRAEADGFSSLWYPSSTGGGDPLSAMALAGRATSGIELGTAVLVTYAFNDFWKLSGRVEYVSTSGPANILYGTGSNAFSFTITPTWQYKRFFVRPELSYISASSTTAGAALGQFGNDTDQFRGLIETGILF